MKIFIDTYQLLFLKKIRRKATEKEMVILNENTIKHLKVLLFTLTTLPLMVFLKLGSILTSHPLIIQLIGDIDTSNIRSASTVAGMAWFMITFGAVPKKFGEAAMSITFWMFLSFCLSCQWISVVMIIDSPLSTPILFGIFGSLYIAAVQYDTMDTLKAGLDDSLLRHSRLGRAVWLRALGKEGPAIEAGREPTLSEESNTE